MSTRGTCRDLDDLDVAVPRRGSMSFCTDAVRTVACLSGPGESSPVGLLVWGEFTGRTRSELLFRPLLRLLDRFRPWATSPTSEPAATVARAARPSRPELVFPDDYLPGTSPAMTALYRLAGCVLPVPSLRECPQDIPPLVEHFLRTFARETGVRLRGITVKALRRLVAHPWPGNVRELRHEVRRLVGLCGDGGVIDAGRLSPRIAAAPTTPESAASEALLLGPRLRELETRLLREALRRTGGRQVHAARLLGVSRNGLADKIKRLGIDLAAFRPRSERDP